MTLGLSKVLDHRIISTSCNTAGVNDTVNMQSMLPVLKYYVQRHLLPLATNPNVKEIGVRQLANLLTIMKSKK